MTCESCKKELPEKPLKALILKTKEEFSFCSLPCLIFFIMTHTKGARYVTRDPHETE